MERWWKGGSADKTVLHTSFTKYSDGGESATSCEYDFRVGESYLVYAYSNAGPIKGLVTSPCTRTAKLGEAGADLEELGAGRSPEKKQ